jgi:hypothetical protein
MVFQYPEGSLSFVGNMISAVTETFNSESELSDLTEFYESRPDSLGSGRRPIEDAIVRTRSNVDWTEKNSRKIVDWLRQKNELPRF